MKAADGATYLLSLAPERLKHPGGRPPGIARDVSLLLHFEYLRSFGKFNAPDAHKELARIFHLRNESRIPSTLERASETYLKGFQERLFSQGVKEADGKITGRCLAIFEQLGSVRKIGAPPDVSVQIDGRAFISTWGDRDARFGRLTGSTDRLGKIPDQFRST